MEQRILALQENLRQLFSGEEGQDLVEYGLLAAMLGVGAVAGIGHVADVVTKMFTHISTTLNTYL